MHALLLLLLFFIFYTHTLVNLNKTTSDYRRNKTYLVAVETDFQFLLFFYPTPVQRDHVFCSLFFLVLKNASNKKRFESKNPIEI